MNDDHECSVCLSPLIDAIDLACGHAFCRLCLLKATRLAPDGRSCPLCRSVVDIPSLRNHPAAEGHVVAVRSLLGDDVYAARLAQHQLEVEELTKLADVELPIFFMHPGARVGGRVGLHLFEPRYKILIRRAWEVVDIALNPNSATLPAPALSCCCRGRAAPASAVQGNKLFVYCGCYPQPGAPGVIVRIDQATFLPDGRANILGHGVEGIALSEVWVEDGTGGLYYTATHSLSGSAPSNYPSSPERDSDEALAAPTRRLTRCSCVLL